MLFLSARRDAAAAQPVSAAGQPVTNVIARITPPASVICDKEIEVPVTAELSTVQQRQEGAPPDGPGQSRGGNPGGEAAGLVPFAFLMESARREAPQEGTQLPLYPPDGGAIKGRFDEGDGAGEKDGLPAAAKKTGSVSRKAGSPAVKGNEGIDKNAVGAMKGHLPYAQEAQAANVKQKFGPAHAVPDKTDKAQGSEPAVVLSRKQTAGADGPARDTARNNGGSRTDMQAEGMRRHPVLNGHNAEGVRAPAAEPEPGKTAFRAALSDSLSAGEARGGKNNHPHLQGMKKAAPAGKEAGTDRESIAPVKNNDGAGIDGGKKIAGREEIDPSLKSGLKEGDALRGRVTLLRPEGGEPAKSASVKEDIADFLKSAPKDRAGVNGAKIAAHGGAEKTSDHTAVGERAAAEDQAALKAEIAAAGHEKAGDRKNRGRGSGISRRETSSLSSPSERDFSVGTYQQNTALHGAGKAPLLSGNGGISPRTLIDQIAGGVKTPGRVRIALNPPNLGTLDMDVMVRGTKVHVVLQTDNNEVKQILQSHVESLRGALRSQGLVADSIQVLTQDKTDGGGYGYERNEPFFGESGGRERDGSGRDESGAVSRYVPPSPGEEPRSVRSDGRISVFA